MSDLALESSHVRRELAELWAFRARAEASAERRFRALAARARAVGVGGGLPEGAERAADDERRHHALCLEVAGWFGGADVAPLVPYEVVGPAPSTVERVVREVVAACCLGETLSMRVMTASLVRTRHDAMRAVQRAILRDEVGHAALGWRFLKRARDLVDLAFLGPLLPSMLGLPSRARLFEPAPDVPERDRLERLGWLPREAVRALFLDALARTIWPRLERAGVDTRAAREAVRQAASSPTGPPVASPAGSANLP